MRPHTSYPYDEPAPPGPAWVTLLPGQRSPIDELTTEVPVIRPEQVTAPEETTEPEHAIAPADAIAPEDAAAPADATAPEPATAPDRREEVPAASDDPQPTSGARPGDVDQAPIAIWQPEQTDQLRQRWRELQGEFIDDPSAAVNGARSLVTEAVRMLSDRLLSEQEAFDPHRDTDRPDTEAMRVAMRRYREFLERVLAL